MKPTDIVRLLNDGTGTVVFKLIPARIPTIIESGEKQYLRALVNFTDNFEIFIHVKNECTCNTLKLFLYCSF